MTDPEEHEARIRRAEETAVTRTVERINLTKSHVITFAIRITGSRKDAEASIGSIIELYPLLGLAEASIRPVH